MKKEKEDSEKELRAKLIELRSEAEQRLQKEKEGADYKLQQLKDKMEKEK